ncbi:MAG: MerR family transcriptional regulator [Saprospiraceae bacterium]|nr:MerR family transcriptional regulator [Saprospiraceae bacterium]
MVIYSIKDIEKLSGVKAHTLRVWEKRYDIVTPRRTETNIRYYLEEDLQKILNIALLNKNGIKISKIAGMQPNEISSKVAEISEIDTQHEGQVDGLMLSMFELNETKFSKILNKHIESDGMEETMDKVIYPFLDRISSMWFTGSIKGVHESFVTHIIRRKLHVVIDQLKSESAGSKCIIYLPEGETQELSLLYLHFVLKHRGHDVINLGTNVAIIDVLEAQAILKAKCIFTFFNDSFTDMDLQPYLDNLSRHVTDCKICISGYQTVSQQLELKDNVVILNSINDLTDAAII